jgi:hypothetical protein
MRRDKKAKPAGVCNVCRAPSAHHEAVNQRCNQVINGRRCAGNFRSGLTELWDECGACQATGRVGREACTACAGFGWTLYG